MCDLVVKTVEWDDGVDCITHAFNHTRTLSECQTQTQQTWSSSQLDFLQPGDIPADCRAAVLLSPASPAQSGRTNWQQLYRENCVGSKWLWEIFLCCFHWILILQRKMCDLCVAGLFGWALLGWLPDFQYFPAISDHSSHADAVWHISIIQAGKYRYKQAIFQSKIVLFPKCISTHSRLRFTPYNSYMMFLLIGFLPPIRDVKMYKKWIL